MNKQKVIRRHLPAILLALYSGFTSAMPASTIILRRYMDPNSTYKPEVLIIYSIITLIAGVSFVVIGIRWMRKCKKEKNEKDPEDKLWKIDYSLAIGMTVIGIMFIVLSLLLMLYRNY